MYSLARIVKVAEAVREKNLLGLTSSDKSRLLLCWFFWPTTEKMADLYLPNLHNNSSEVGRPGSSAVLHSDKDKLQKLFGILALILVL